VIKLRYIMMLRYEVTPT